MRARMTARSAVPKGLAKRENPGAAARRGTTVARCLPKSISLRSTPRTRPMRLGVSHAGPGSVGVQILGGRLSRGEHEQR